MSVKVVLLAVVLWCAVTCVKGDDDDWCTNDQGNRVHTSDCPHNCCVNGDCGSDSECKAVLIIVLSVLGGVACCAVVISLLVCYCMKCCCFATEQQTQIAYTQAPLVAPMAGQAHPHYGVPLQDQQPGAYPAGQQPGAYPAGQQPGAYPVQQPGQQPYTGYPLPPQAQKADPSSIPTYAAAPAPAPTEAEPLV